MFIGVFNLFIGTFASRIVGFLREYLTAYHFGTGPLKDAFEVAFMIPNLFRRVLGEETIESAFLPAFKSLTAQGKTREAWRTASVVLNWLLIGTTATAAICYVIAPQLVSYVFAPGFDRATARETTLLGRLMCPFIILIGLEAFLGSLLLAQGQNLAYSTAPVLFNLGWVAAIVLWHKGLGIYSLGWGVLLGGVLYVFASAGAMLIGGRGRIPRGGCDFSAGLKDPEALRIVRLAVPVSLAALVVRGASIVDRVVASFLPQGSIATLSYALHLVHLPFALFGLSVGRAAIAPLSERSGLGDMEGFRATIRSAIRVGLVILIPLSVGTAVLAYPFSRVLESGKFDDTSTRMTAVAVRYYALGLAGMGFVSLLSRTIYALKDTSSPFWTSVCAQVMNVVLSIGLALTPMRHGGIALATSIAMTFQSIRLFSVMRKRLREHGVIGGFSDLWGSVAKVCLATAAMAAVAAAVGMLTRSYQSRTVSFSVRCSRLIIPGAAGAAFYAAVMFVLDRDAVMRVLRRRRVA